MARLAIKATAASVVMLVTCACEHALPSGAYLSSVSLCSRSSSLAQVADR